MTTATDETTGTLVERLGLKTIVESCLVLEDGIAALKDIETGMMMGAGILPGPFDTDRLRGTTQKMAEARKVAFSVVDAGDRTDHIVVQKLFARPRNRP